MATVQVPWTTGSGHITLTYTGQGNGTISVSSDPNDVYVERSQTVTVQTTAGGTVTKTLTVKQSAKVPNFLLYGGDYFITSDGDHFNVTEE